MNFVFSFPIAVLSQYFFGTIIFILSLFMVLLILVQRGKGGGLTGALGGPGGQSAFGTKAGDLFTRITIVAAACWIFLLAFCVWWYTESDFSAALADSPVLGTGPAIGAPADGGMSGTTSSDPTMPTTGTTEATSPVVPSGQAPADASAKPAAEVEAGDLPKATEPNSKESEKSSTEPPKTTEPAKEPESTKPADKTDAEPPKPASPAGTEPAAAPSTPPELAPPEPASSEPKVESSAPSPTPEK